MLSGFPGWLGNRLVDRITKETKWKLRCLVMRNYNVEGDYQVVRGDIREYYSLIDATKDVDVVIHAAGIIHAKPKMLMDINTDGTLNMLKASIKNNVNKFIYISSNSAVGYTKDKVLMTESTPRKPYMTYGLSKFLAEEYVNGYNLDYNLNTIILRPCWFYSPEQPKRQTKLFKMVQGGHPIIIGDGTNIRSMTYIDNLVDAIILSVNSNLSGKTYWIADERPYTTNEIYDTIANILKVKDYEPRHLPDKLSSVCRTGDKVLQSLGMYSQYLHVAGEMTLNIACDISRAKRELGYTPIVGLKEGMDISIQWCKRNKLL